MPGHIFAPLPDLERSTSGSIPFNTQMTYKSLYYPYPSLNPLVKANRNPNEFFHYPAHHIHETRPLMEYYHPPDAFDKANTENPHKYRLSAF